MSQLKLKERAEIQTGQGSIVSLIKELDVQLEHHFRDTLQIESSLSRQLVSFQANKSRPIYRWYKFKEAFSAALVEWLFNRYRVFEGRIIDPFAGAGTALFMASELGLDADGIELLPIGREIIDARICLQKHFKPADFELMRGWLIKKPWLSVKKKRPLTQIRITEGAYPAETVDAIEHYLACLVDENKRIQLVLRFALLCVLESISYTRKDGQYLRWDYRSGRRQRTKPFDKGRIFSFDEAITTKLSEILADLEEADKPTKLFPSETLDGQIKLYSGSCLNILPTLQVNSYSAIVTSPPYCNRYDYTRTYALELALLGHNDEDLASLRQTMISCTVENRAKDLIKMNSGWRAPIKAADNQELLQNILDYLNEQKAKGALNNTGIPRMVRGYFYEMACVIAECARVLKPGAPMFMVNDNVRYAGVSIPVDLILSSIAEDLGFSAEAILQLPKGKGNSSQQMAVHGRESLRKSVYVWRKR